jgi:hypothetical protein
MLPLNRQLSDGPNNGGAPASPAEDTPPMPSRPTIEMPTDGCVKTLIAQSRHRSTLTGMRLKWGGGGNRRGKSASPQPADPTNPAAAPRPNPRIAPISSHAKTLVSNPRKSKRNQEVNQPKAGEGAQPTSKAAPARGLSGVSIWSGDPAGGLSHLPPLLAAAAALLTDGEQHSPTTTRKERMRGDWFLLGRSGRLCYTIHTAMRWTRRVFGIRCVSREGRPWEGTRKPPQVFGGGPGLVEGRPVGDDGPLADGLPYQFW